MFSQPLTSVPVTSKVAVAAGAKASPLTTPSDQV